MDNYPIVSIITPNFNGSRFIPRVVEAVRRQTYSRDHIEHIIVDDCSTDDSWQLLQMFASSYSWLRPIRLESNSGPVVARNKAIEVSQGRFLAFLDVDDLWLENKLETQIAFMLKHHCVLSFSDYRFISAHGQKIGRRLCGFDKIGWHLHHMTRYLGCLTIILDRAQFIDFRIPEIKPATRAEDFLAWSKCIKMFGPVLRCPYDLARYAVVANSRSAAKKGSISVWRLYRNLEKIPLSIAIFYFFSYSVTVFWKRFRYGPRFERGSIDSDFQWSIIVDNDPEEVR